MGTQTVTATYSGDASTQGSLASINQVVNAAFSLPGGGGDTTLTVKSGQSVSAPINVTAAPGFSGPVTLACVGLPTNATCSFSPAIINVSGSAPVPSLVTINTAANSTVSQLSRAFSGYGLPFAGLILLLPWRRRRARLFIVLPVSLSLLSLGFAVLALSGCGSGSSNTPAPRVATGTYLFTITARSGSLQEQSTYALVVQ